MEGRFMSETAVNKANVLWFLPTHGEGRYLGTSIGARAADFNYLRQVAQAPSRWAQGSPGCWAVAAPLRPGRSSR